MWVWVPGLLLLTKLQGRERDGSDCPQVLEDVTGEEFVLLMRVVSALRVLQTVSGRQQLVELVVEQAFLEQALNTADPDTVDRLLQCTRQALPLFSVSVRPPGSCLGKVCVRL